MAATSHTLYLRVSLLILVFHQASFISLTSISRLHDVFFTWCLVDPVGHRLRLRPRPEQGAAYTGIYDEKTAYEECTTYDLGLILT
jgi:hypothetical protein